MAKTFPYEALGTCDLVVDAVYKGLAKTGATQTHFRDPFSPLLGVRAEGGFRWKGRIDTSPFMVIYSDFLQAEWPDRIDDTTGEVVYFGDNRRPGNELHDLPGNRWLRDTFTAVLVGNRKAVVPTFVFSKGPEGRDTCFRGLAIPCDLIAVWRSKNGERFQNYRSTFTILNELSISREWINSMKSGQPAINEHAPESWISWVGTAKVKALTSTPVSRLRSRNAQLPSNPGHMRILEWIHSHFQASPFEFEKFAKWLIERMDPNVTRIDLTRPWRDGGRDGLGVYRIGLPASAVEVEFAIEAKCYNPRGNGVGVKEMSRLISRLRHRQFGVLVTTSYLHIQAYEEVTEDGHPVVVVAGVDVIDLLPEALRSANAIKPWLETQFPTNRLREEGNSAGSCAGAAKNTGA